mgnify:CR=1 FL=1
MKKCSKTLLGLALAAAMSLSLIVPASAVYCPHDYYASTAVWYTDDGPRLQTRHWQMTIRCHNCGYADAEKEHTFPVRLELPELKEMVSLLRYASNNINQIARRMNESGRIYDTDLEQVVQNQEQLWDMANGILTRLAAIK